MDPLQKLIAFLGRHFGPPRLFLLIAAWILALGVWGMTARNYFPIEHKLHWDIPLELRAPLYAKFDSGWYLSIMEWGYGPPPPEGKPSSHAFFPLYPVTSKVLRDTFAMDGFHAGLIVTYLCFFLAAALFLREGIARLGAADGWRSVAFLLLFPTAFFFAAVYAESMLLLFTLLAFREARRGSTGRAILFGALAGFTRAFAIVLGPALLLAALEAPREEEVPRDKTRGSLWRAVVIGAAPVAAVFLWIWWLGFVKQEPGLYFRSLEGWQRGSNPLSGVASFFAGAADHALKGDLARDFALDLDYFLLLVFAGIGVYQLVRRRWSDAAFTAAAVALPVSTGLPGGTPRFLAIVYPAYYALAEATRRSPRTRWALLALSGILLLASAARFVNWLWVA